MAVTLKGQTAVYEGTSTDTKPTDADNNAIFKELDTGIRYYYDGTDWNEIPSSGGGGGGGTGTDNYNDLNNKPSINGTTLSGNKSLDNLGIQAKLTFDSTPTEDSENPVESGGVYSALAGKQDAISDLSTIRSGAAAGASAVQPAAMEEALAGKQDALSSEQLDAVNSGIDSAKVKQIETNKNNILYNTDNGVKNVLNFTLRHQSGRVTFDNIGNNTVELTSSEATSAQVICTLYTGEIPADYYAIKVIANGITLANDDVFVNVVYDIDGGATNQNQNVTDVLVFRNNKIIIKGVYVYVRSGKQPNGTIQVMICPTNLYDVSSKIVPYAMSNAELTAAIQALQAQLNQ